MYNTVEIKSGLVTGIQWDTVMKWLQNSGYNVSTNSRSWGNYNNSTSPANVAGRGKLQATGYSEYWKSNNMYDISGNICEWIAEISGKNRVFRGGSYNAKGEKEPSSYRDAQPSTYINVRIGFRCVLYLK